jgi:hypothetical protein
LKDFIPQKNIPYIPKEFVQKISEKVVPYDVYKVWNLVCNNAKNI